MASSYWRKMHTNFIVKTTLATYMGLYELVVMSFGLCNAGATFQRAMKTILEGLRHSLVYIDDIFTHRSDFDSHIANLRETSKRLRRAKSSKCSFGVQTNKLLDNVISDEGVKINESRKEVIRKYPKPKKPKQRKQHHNQSTDSNRTRRKEMSHFFLKGVGCRDPTHLRF
jgi:hypothetical protein